MKKVIFVVFVACAIFSLVSGVPVERRDDDLEGSEFLQNDVLEAGEEKFFGGNGRGNVFRPADVDSESDGTAKQALAADKGRWFGGNGRGMVFRRAVEDTENAEQVAGATSDHYFGGPRGGGVF